MKRKVSDIQRKGVNVGEVSSSKGDKTYEIFQDGDKLTCNCIGYAMRRKCRHIERKEEGV